jgi:hypothetical protein
MKKSSLRLSALLTLVSLLGLSGCGGVSSVIGGATGTIITAVDGYIKDGNLTDAAGQVATYNAVGGKYVFASSPTYPLSFTGGTFEDTNASFDINMTSSSGTVISPITTFVDGNSTILGKLANLGLSGNPAALSEFEVDYVDTNNTDLAKLSQLLYLVQKDSNLTKKLRADLNVTSLSALYTHIESDINTTVTGTTLQSNMRTFLQKVKDINGTTAIGSYERALQNYKQSLPTITWKGKTYGQVISPFTGKVWLDRNLGATRVATAVDDNQSYGDYYQWGRGVDGHQESNSTTTTPVTDINATNANGSFIINSSSPYDWTTADSNGSLRSANWSKTDGTSICPVGYRVPTITELSAETLNASTAVANGADAFNNFLKLPSAGFRDSSDGSVLYLGFRGFVWASSVTGSLFFDSNTAVVYTTAHAIGSAVRCLKN